MIMTSGRIITLDTPGGLKTHVRDLNVVEVETFGTQKARWKSCVPSVCQFNLCGGAGNKADPVCDQTGRGAEAVPDVMSTLDGLKSGTGDYPEFTLEITPTSVW